MTATIVPFEQQQVASMSEGFTRLANGLVDQLMVASGLTARELRVVLAVVRNTYGYQLKARRITENDLSNWTGIEAKNCGKLKRGLIKRGVLLLTRGELSINKQVSDWDCMGSSTTPAGGRAQPRSKKQHGVVGNPVKGSPVTPSGGYVQPRQGVAGNPPYKENSKETFKDISKNNSQQVPADCPSAERTPTTEKKSLLDRVQEKHPTAVIATRTGKAALWGEHIDEQLANLLADAVADVTLDDKRPNIAAWANEIRLMRHADERTPEQIAALFRFANTDEFWRSNILSPHKLRAKWGVLAAKFNERRHTPSALDTSAAGTNNRLNDTSWATPSKEPDYRSAEASMKRLTDTSW